MVPMPAVASLRSDLVAVIADEVETVESVQATTSVAPSKVAVVLAVLQVLEVHQVVSSLLRFEFSGGDEVVPRGKQIMTCSVIERHAFRKQAQLSRDHQTAPSAGERTFVQRLKQMGLNGCHDAAER